MISLYDYLTVMNYDHIWYLVEGIVWTAQCTAMSLTGLTVHCEGSIHLVRKLVRDSRTKSTQPSKHYMQYKVVENYGKHTTVCPGKPPEIFCTNPVLLVHCLSLTGPMFLHQIQTSEAGWIKLAMATCPSHNHQSTERIKAPSRPFCFIPFYTLLRPCRGFSGPLRICSACVHF